jgi:anti-sigma factor RsiW
VKTNLTCEACERELCAYLDGALHPAIARALESHLESCGRCGARLGAYREISSRLAELPEIEAPAWIESRVLDSITGRARARRFWSRGFAAAAAFSFAATVGLIAHLPALARQWGLPEPATWPVLALRTVLDGIVAVAKRLALDVTFYEPLARQVWTAVSALGALPRAALVTLRTTEAQLMVAVAITLGVALYLALRPSRTREGGIGHACLSL